MTRSPLPLLASVDLGAFADMPAHRRPVRIPHRTVGAVLEAGALLAEARSRAAGIADAAEREASDLERATQAHLAALRRSDAQALADARDAAVTLLLDECREAVTRVVVDAMGGLLHGAGASTRAASLVGMLIDREGQRLRDAALKLGPEVDVGALPELPPDWSVEIDATAEPGSVRVETPSGHLSADWVGATDRRGTDAGAANRPEDDPYAFIPVVAPRRATAGRAAP